MEHKCSFGSQNVVLGHQLCQGSSGTKKKPMHWSVVMIDSIVALKIIISPPLYYSIFAFMGES
jgi:hypothetical protein